MPGVPAAPDSALALSGAASGLPGAEGALMERAVGLLRLMMHDCWWSQGLSPSEITQCLQDVQSRNGLSPVLRSAVDASAGKVANQSGRVWSLIKHYGVASIATMLLAYGYWAFRNKLVARAIAVRHASVVTHRTKRNAEMETVLTHLQEQRQQFLTVGSWICSGLSGWIS